MAAVVVVVVAGDFVVVEVDEVLAAAGDFADEVFGAAGEVCAELNPAGRRARRAIAMSGLIGFMETEPFFLMRLKKLVPNVGALSGRADIGATRADRYVGSAAYRVTLWSVNH